MRGGFTIFDAHTHIGTARHSGRWYSAEDLLRDMDRVGVDRSMVIPFPVVEEHRASHDLIGAAVKAHPDRLSGAACLYPYIPEWDFRDEVRRCREQYGFRALKLQPQYHGLNPGSPASRFFFDTAHKNRMAVICHTGSGLPFSLPSLLIAPARRFPELPIVIAHCGGGIFVDEAILAATVCPNIFLELSSLMPHHVHEVLACVASERVMLGSDLPDNLETEFGKIFTMNLAPESRRNILGATALKLFVESAC